MASISLWQQEAGKGANVLLESTTGHLIFLKQVSCLTFEALHNFSKRTFEV